MIVQAKIAALSSSILALPWFCPVIFGLLACSAPTESKIRFDAMDAPDSALVDNGKVPPDVSQAIETEVDSMILLDADLETPPQDAAEFDTPDLLGEVDADASASSDLFGGDAAEVALPEAVSPDLGPVDCPNLPAMCPTWRYDSVENPLNTNTGAAPFPDYP